MAPRTLEEIDSDEGEDDLDTFEIYDDISLTSSIDLPEMHKKEVIKFPAKYKKAILGKRNMAQNSKKMKKN